MAVRTHPLEITLAMAKQVSSEDEAGGPRVQTVVRLQHLRTRRAVEREGRTEEEGIR